MTLVSTWLAATYLSWLPGFSPAGLLALLLVCFAVWLGLRLGWGPAHSKQQAGLFALRGAALAILFVILLGPTVVDEQSGEVTRPSMLYLLDGSQSMQLGNEETRWQESLRFLEEAETSAGKTQSSNVQAFRFGHRLQPLTDSAAISLAEENTPAIAPPEATDSRLGDALRQLLPQIQTRTAAGIVLCSDGRVRGSEAVERLAEICGEAQVPIHVVPVGHASGAGDIAIVSLVVPKRVSKYSENQLQVFLRSYGYTGERTMIRVLSRDKTSGTPATTLASVPITLSGGAQAASVTFRMNDRPEDLEVVIDPLADELTTRNNRVETQIEIDRTKIRVLYVEGDRATNLNNVFGGFFSLDSGDSTASLNVRSALQEDDDIECVVFQSSDGSIPRTVSIGNNPQDVIFPRTRAELFAYDCIIFSNVGPNMLSDEQNQWLAQWIEGRGGGFIVTGGEALDPGLWLTSPLTPLLPVRLEDARPIGLRSTSVAATEKNHPIWRLRLEKSLNDQVLSLLPPLQIQGGGWQVKSTAEVLAEETESGAAVIMAHRAGRGRVVVASANLGGTALTELADRWGPQPERVAAKFWRNLVYWASEGSSTGRRRLVASADKQFYRPGETISIFATAYDEAARLSNKYRLWGMLEPSSLEDVSLYSPVLWPDNVVRESGEVGSHIAWGEELPLVGGKEGEGYRLDLQLSEMNGSVDSGIRIELTAYEGNEAETAYGHGTQVDSSSLAIQILSDPFEQQNPLPNHDLLKRLAAVSGGEVLTEPSQLAQLLADRPQMEGLPRRDVTPAWSHWWLWLSIVGLLSTEWFWRRISGLA